MKAIKPWTPLRSNIFSISKIETVRWVEKHLESKSVCKTPKTQDLMFFVSKFASKPNFVPKF